MEKNFEQFYDKIKLTENQREDAKTKYTGVCKVLHKYFYDTDYDGKTKLLIGSYRKDTHIRPARDVDVVFKLPSELFEQYDDNEGNSQSQLLQKVRGVLMPSYPKTEIGADQKVVAVETADGKHDVEVVPAWECEGGIFKIPNSSGDGSWEYVDYRTDIKRVADSEADTGKTKFLIRVIKKWRDQVSTCTLSSYDIERLVLDFLDENEVQDLGYSVLVKDFFFYAKGNSDDENSSFFNTAHGRAVKAGEFEASGDMSQATDEWKKIFGNDFPTYSEKGVTQGDDLLVQIRALTLEYPSLQEQFLEEDFGIAFAEDVGNLELRVGVNGDGFRPNSLIIEQFREKGWRLPKRAVLNFSVLGLIPYIYDEVKWKVRNFGDAAQRAGKLRGEISSTGRSLEKDEPTEYRGEHYVECYLIRGDVCIAFGRAFVPID